MKQTFLNWQPWSIVAAVIVVMATWRVVALHQRPAGIAKLTTELGSVAEFWGEPRPNTGGTRILFRQSTERGEGIFLGEVPCGRRHLLWQQTEGEFNKGDFLHWGWSPDGKLFAYSRRPDKQSARELVIGNGQDGRTTGVVRVQASVVDLTWLSETALVFVDSHQNLYKVERLGETRWGSPQSFAAEGEKPAKRPKGAEKKEPPIRGLAALDETTVVFQRDQGVWTWTFGASGPAQLWEAATNVLVEYSLDSEKKHLLLHCRDVGGEALCSFHWPSRSSRNLARLPPGYAEHIEWLDGNGYVCVRGSILEVRRDPEGSPADVAFSGGLNSCVGNGDGVYAVGSIAGEPLGIWKYDTGSDTLRCVVSNSRPALKHASAVVPASCSLTNAEGRRIRYRLWSPPVLKPQKRYPLMIGQVGPRWLEYPELIANAGAYFASVDVGAEGGRWEGAVLPVCEEIEGRCSIDKSSLFLYGVCGFVPHINAVLEMEPDLWRGAILFSADSLPDLTRVRVPRILIDCGEDDPRVKTVRDYGTQAAASGTLVTVVLHEKAGHVYKSIAALRARDEAVVKFLFGR